MDTHEYDLFVRRMCTKRGEFMPRDVAAMGLASEAGEVAGLCKKEWEKDRLLNRVDMLKELGDVAFYVTVVAAHYGFGLEEILAANVDKLEQRFPERNR